jgi:glucose-1-phosphate thymidylyltransferase
MDCGNKNATVETNSKILEYEKECMAKYPESASHRKLPYYPALFYWRKCEISNSKIGLMFLLVKTQCH